MSKFLRSLKHFLPVSFVLDVFTPVADRLDSLKGEQIQDGNAGHGSSSCLCLK